MSKKIRESLNLLTFNTDHDQTILIQINIIMKRKFKQRWSSIPPISTKRTITSHLN